MAGSTERFFFTARNYGIKPVILCLTDTNLPDWRGRKAYLNARFERDQYFIYGLDLLWLLAVKQYPNADLPQPSQITKSARNTDHRTATEIKNDILSRL